MTPATTAMTVFFAMDRHGSGDSTSCSIVLGEALGDAVAAGVPEASPQS